MWKQYPQDVSYRSEKIFVVNSESILKSILRYINHYRNNIYSGFLENKFSGSGENWKENVRELVMHLENGSRQYVKFNWREENGRGSHKSHVLASLPQGLMPMQFHISFSCAADIFLCVNQNWNFFLVEGAININLNFSYYF